LLIRFSHENFLITFCFPCYDELLLETSLRVSAPCSRSVLQSFVNSLWNAIFGQSSSPAGSALAFFSKSDCIRFSHSAQSNNPL
jgi:hypothetical protein